jgi:hypothetical protein
MTILSIQTVLFLSVAVAVYMLVAQIRDLTY